MDSTLVFHPDPAINFGVLTIKVPKGDLIGEPQTIIFTIDRSGSMDDRCSDGRTKMQHAAHTTKNLWDMLAAQQGITGALYTFDDKVDTIIPPQVITDDNKAESFQKISGIMPRGSTNIELALKNAQAVISAQVHPVPPGTPLHPVPPGTPLHPVHHGTPLHPVTHILMTDGNATEGCKDPAALGKLLYPQAMNIIIGYGIDHSAPMLAALGKGVNASYYFIDQIEKGGLVFGEIFHSIFFKRYIHVTFESKTGLEFYDFRTDTWAPSLAVDALLSESERTFHVRFADRGDRATYGEKGATVTLSDRQGSIDKVWSCETADVQKYIFRQRTQELLYAAQKTPVDPALKARLKAVLAEMKGYMDAHLLNGDAFYVALCDDLAIAIRTYGTEHAYMFVTGRINSNGFERAYNICSLPPRAVRRQNGCIGRTASIAPHVSFLPDEEANGGNESQDNGEDIGHEISLEEVNPTRVTPSMSRAMRSASHY